MMNEYIFIVRGACEIFSFLYIFFFYVSDFLMEYSVSYFRRLRMPIVEKASIAHLELQMEVHFLRIPPNNGDFNALWSLL